MPTIKIVSFKTSSNSHVAVGKNGKPEKSKRIGKQQKVGHFNTAQRFGSQRNEQNKKKQNILLSV